MEKTILVTGGAGFIGSAVVRTLVAAGVPVVNVDCLTYAGTLSSLEPVRDAPGHRFERVDIRDRGAVEAVFRRYRPRAVLHLAAESHVDRSIDDPSPFVGTNVLGTFHLLEAARRHWRRLPAGDRREFRFVHVSTDEVFGSLGEEGAFTEGARYDPSSPYSATKAAGDHLALAWQRTYGLPVIVTNTCNNYGPYQFPEKFIPHMVLRALEGRSLPVYGDGTNVRDWLFVYDHVDALRRVLEAGRPGEVYNVGGRAERRNLDVVERLCDLLDELAPRGGGRSHRERISFVEDRPGHDRRYAIDPGKIETELGWSARTGFEEGLRRTVEWYLANRAWWSRLRAERYGGQRLGTGGGSLSWPGRRAAGRGASATEPRAAGRRPSAAEPRAAGGGGG